MKTTVGKCVYWTVVALAFALIMGIMSLLPQAAQAAELTASDVTGTTITTQATTTQTSSSSAKNPYSDVTKKSVGKTAWTSVRFVKSKGGYKGIIRGTYYKKVKGGLYKKVKGKFKPNKKVTRKEFLAVMTNLYGENMVPVTYGDVKDSNKTVTAKYVCNKMVAVAEKLGKKITWDAEKGVKLNRASVANYVSVFAHFDSAFMPK